MFAIPWDALGVYVYIVDYIDLHNTVIGVLGILQLFYF